MAETTTRIEGLRELDRTLAQLPKATQRNTLRRVALRHLEPIASAAAARAPDDPLTSGRDLKRGIAVSTRLSSRQARLRRAFFSRRDDPWSVEMFAGVSYRVAHAHFQEFGTEQLDPQPYMRPAWDGAKNDLLPAIAADLWTEIDKAAARFARRQARQAKG